MNLNHLLVKELVSYLMDNSTWFADQTLDAKGLEEVLTSFFEQEHKPKAAILAGRKEG